MGIRISSVGSLRDHELHQGLAPIPVWVLEAGLWDLDSTEAGSQPKPIAVRQALAHSITRFFDHTSLSLVLLHGTKNRRND